MSTKKKRKKSSLYQGITIVIAPHSHKNTYKININKNFILFFYTILISSIFLAIFTLFKRTELYSLNKKTTEQYSESQKLQYLLDQHVMDIYTSLEEFRTYGYSLYETIWQKNDDLIADQKINYLDNENLTLSTKFLKQIKYLEKSINFLNQQQDVFENLPLGWPVKAGFISSTYGYRPSPFGFTEEFHSGYDFANTIGTPVYATANGTVNFSGSNASGYGIHVKIDHKYGFSTLYGHGSAVKVQKDQLVKRGDLIMLLGQSGNVTGPHTHYEVRLNTGTPEIPYEIMLNPIHFLKNN